MNKTSLDEMIGNIFNNDENTAQTLAKARKIISYTVVNNCEFVIEDDEEEDE